MSAIHRIRLYHATLAILSILAYLTGDLGIVHAWLGYGVAAIIAFRLLWALSGNPHVGLMRFYPSFDGLKRFFASRHYQDIYDGHRAQPHGSYRYRYRNG
jgi:cytochrome b